MTCRDEEIEELRINEDGNCMIHIYYRGDYYKPTIPMSALVAYPVLGNAQFNSLMEQCRFLIDEIGFRRGIYRLFQPCLRLERRRL